MRKVFVCFYGFSVMLTASAVWQCPAITRENIMCIPPTFMSQIRLDSQLKRQFYNDASEFLHSDAQQLFGQSPPVSMQDTGQHICPPLVAGLNMIPPFMKNFLESYPCPNINSNDVPCRITEVETLLSQDPGTIGGGILSIPSPLIDAGTSNQYYSTAHINFARLKKDRDCLLFPDCDTTTFYPDVLINDQADVTYSDSSGNVYSCESDHSSTNIPLHYQHCAQNALAAANTYVNMTGRNMEYTENNVFSDPAQATYGTTVPPAPNYGIFQLGVKSMAEIVGETGFNDVASVDKGLLKNFFGDNRPYCYGDDPDDPDGDDYDNGGRTVTRFIIVCKNSDTANDCLSSDGCDNKANIGCVGETADYTSPPQPAFPYVSYLCPATDVDPVPASVFVTGTECGVNDQTKQKVMNPDVVQNDNYIVVNSIVDIVFLRDFYVDHMASASSTQEINRLLGLTESPLCDDDDGDDSNNCKLICLQFVNEAGDTITTLDDDCVYATSVSDQYSHPREADWVIGAAIIELIDWPSSTGGFKEYRDSNITSDNGHIITDWLGKNSAIAGQNHNDYYNLRGLKRDLWINRIFNDFGTVGSANGYEQVSWDQYQEITLAFKLHDYDPISQTTFSPEDKQNLQVQFLDMLNSGDLSWRQRDFALGQDTPSPTLAPTQQPTNNPTGSPTASPTKDPTTSPTLVPTENPTKSPTKSPTVAPTYPDIRYPWFNSVSEMCHTMFEGCVPRDLELGNIENFNVPFTFRPGTDPYSYTSNPYKLNGHNNWVPFEITVNYNILMAVFNKLRTRDVTNVEKVLLTQGFHDYAHFSNQIGACVQYQFQLGALHYDNCIVNGVLKLFNNPRDADRALGMALLYLTQFSYDDLNLGNPLQYLDTGGSLYNWSPTSSLGLGNEFGTHFDGDFSSFYNSVTDTTKLISEDTIYYKFWIGRIHESAYPGAAFFSDVEDTSLTVSNRGHAVKVKMAIDVSDLANDDKRKEFQARLMAVLQSDLRSGADRDFRYTKAIMPGETLPPTMSPSESPTKVPTVSPVVGPTPPPPTDEPTGAPTMSPTDRVTRLRGQIDAKKINLDNTESPIGGSIQIIDYDGLKTAILDVMCRRTNGDRDSEDLCAGNFDMQQLVIILADPSMTGEDAAYESFNDVRDAAAAEDQTFPVEMTIALQTSDSALHDAFITRLSYLNDFLADNDADVEGQPIEVVGATASTAAPESDDDDDGAAETALIAVGASVGGLVVIGLAYHYATAWRPRASFNNPTINALFAEKLF